MIETLPVALREKLEKSGALLSGHFILTSGRHSGNYMQCALLCSYPEYCASLAKDLAGVVKRELGTPGASLRAAQIIDAFLR